MNHLKIFENFFDKFDVSDIKLITDLVNIPKTIKPPKCSIYQYEFYGDTGILWILCHYTAKNKIERSKNVSTIYKENMEKIKDKLEDSHYVNKVEIKYMHNFAPWKMDASTGGGLKSNECIYEIRCHIKAEYSDDILDEINMKNNTVKYNI